AVPPSTGTQVLPNSEISDSILIERAKKIVEDLHLSVGKEYEIGLVRYLNENSGTAVSPNGSPQAAEKTIVFDQVINGLQFLDPDAGHIEVSFDVRTKKVKRIRRTLRSYGHFSGETSTSLGMISIEQAREQALKSTGGKEVEVMAGTESIGYYLLNGKVAPVYRALIFNTNAPRNPARQAIIPLLKSNSQQP